MFVLHIHDFLFLKDKRVSTRTLWLSGCSPQFGDFIGDESETDGSNFFLNYTWVWQLEKKMQNIADLAGFPCGTSGKEPPCQYWRHERLWFDPWVRKIPWRRVWQPTSVFLLGESHGQRSLASYGPVQRVAKSWTPQKRLCSKQARIANLVAPSPLRKQGPLKIVITIQRGKWVAVGAEETPEKTSKSFVAILPWLLRFVSQGKVFAKILLGTCP